MRHNPDRKIRLFFVLWDKFPPFRVDVSVLFGKELSQRGFQIDYLMQSEADNKIFRVDEWSNSKAYVGPTDNGTTFFNRFVKHALDIINDLRILKLVKENRYDLIQVKDKFFSAIIALFVARHLRIPFLYWLSYPFPESDIYEFNTKTARYPIFYLIRGLFLKFLLYKIILPFSDHVFVQSDQMKIDVASKGVPEDKITAVPMGVDIDDFRRLTSLGGKQIVHIPNSVVYIGEIKKMRKIDTILRAFKKVLDKIPTAKLFLVGGSPNDSDIEDFKQYAKELKINHALTFTGNLPRAKALEFVAASTIGISPIAPNPVYIPSSPTKIIEYMLLGKPVVANDIPEQKKIITESKAGFCVNFDEDAFAESIIALLTDHAAAKKMGEKGMQYVMQHRSYKRIAGIVERQYIEILSHNN
jgi:glycosyltransferase involved in cell wall biosynthesis